MNFYPFLLALSHPASHAPAAGTGSIIATAFSELMPYASLIFSIYVLFSNRNKEESKQQQLTIKRLEQEVANHGIQHTAFQQERERLVDGFNLRFEQMEKRVSQVDQVLQKVQAVEIRMEAQNVQIAELKNDIRDMRSDLKSSNNEIIALIKSNK